MPWNRLFKRPPGDFWIDAALWLALAAWGLWGVITGGALSAAGYPRASLIATLFALVVAVGYWTAQRWVRWLVISAGLGLAVAMIIMAISSQSLTVMRAIVILCCLWGAWHAWNEQIPSPDDEENAGDDEKPLLSLVLLQREPPFLDATVIARLASKAWEADIRGGSEDAPTSDDDKGDGFVVGDERLFMMMYGPGMFLVHNVDVPYFDDVAAVVEHCKELRTRAAVAEHQAWTAIDLLRLDSDDASIEREAYRLIGRFLAELADETQCLAVFDPASGALHPFDPETEQKLRSDDPVGALREWHYAPIVQVENGDLDAAVEEARTRWPEFVTAFEARDLDDNESFLIKAPFGDGDNVEFMWAAVTALEAETVFAILKNSPHAIPQLHEGDRVRVDVADVCDWLCVVDGKPLGGFTIRAIEEQLRRNEEET